MGRHMRRRWQGTTIAVPHQNWRLRYSTSKLGNVLQARGLRARLRQQGRDIDVFAVDPGLMVDTDLGQSLLRCGLRFG